MPSHPSDTLDDLIPPIRTIRERLGRTLHAADLLRQLLRVAERRERNRPARRGQPEGAADAR